MIDVDKKKALALRSTYLVATATLFVSLTVILVACVASLHQCELLNVKSFSKLALGSALTFVTFGLVDGWLCDKKGGLAIARFFHLWREEDAPGPIIEVAKIRVWEGYTYVELPLFVALAVLTIYSW